MHEERGILRLSSFYYFVQITGIIVIGFFAFTISAYPSLFTFLLQPLLISELMFVMFFVHSVCFLLQEFLHRTFFYALSRYVWIGFFIAFVYLTGGVNSQFLFLLFFPILTAGTDLNARETKYVGIILVCAFGSFLFFATEPLTSQLVIKHVVRTVLFALSTYYLYKMVKETLSEKYEKEENKKKFVELIELDKVKSEFITVVSHQLRTPLSGIKWALNDLSRDEQVPASAKSVVVESLGAVDKSIGIINELISASENKVLGLTLTKTAFALHEPIESAIQNLRGLAQQKNVKIVFEKKSDPELTADKEKLIVAFTNILDNAVKYSRQGAVTIRAGEEGRSVLVEFEDNGMGISEEDIPHVFDRFFRAKEAIDQFPNESGLGLYIAKTIVEKHFGTISISSKVQGGTKVVVTLPLQ